MSVGAGRKKTRHLFGAAQAIRGRAPCLSAASLTLALCAACNPNGQPSTQGNGGAGGMEPVPTVVSPGMLRATVVERALDMTSPLGTFASGGSAGIGGAGPSGGAGGSSLGPPAVPPECIGQLRHHRCGCAGFSRAARAFGGRAARCRAVSCCRPNCHRRYFQDWDRTNSAKERRCHRKTRPLWSYGAC